MQSEPHILVADDDDRIRELLRQYLRDHGFAVSTAENAAQVRELLRLFRFHLIVLDIMMPGESGLELASGLRGIAGAPPVLLLTAMDGPQDRIRGLESGADDYLAKPFEPRELLLRLRAILRRTAPASPEGREVRFGEFVFDLARLSLRAAGEAIYLTTAEAQLLKSLAEQAGRPVSRARLAALSTAAGAPLEERSVDVQITRLRKKIERDTSRPAHIQTRRGEGYVLHARAERGGS